MQMHMPKHSLFPDLLTEWEFLPLNLFDGFMSFILYSFWERTHRTPDCAQDGLEVAEEFERCFSIPSLNGDVGCGCPDLCRQLSWQARDVKEWQGMAGKGKEGQWEVYSGGGLTVLQCLSVTMFWPRRPDLSERRLEEQDMDLMVPRCVEMHHV